MKYYFDLGHPGHDVTNHHLILDSISTKGTAPGVFKPPQLQWVRVEEHKVKQFYELIS